MTNTHHKPAEEAIIKCCMQSSYTLPTIRFMMSKDDEPYFVFHYKVHREILQCVEHLYERGYQHDSLSVEQIEEASKHLKFPNVRQKNWDTLLQGTGSLNYLFSYIYLVIWKFRDGKKESYETYNQYLNTYHWKTISAIARDMAEYRCQICNRDDLEETLHVHHRFYGRKGNELFEDLTVLCAECHRYYHKIVRAKRDNYIDSLKINGDVILYDDLVELINKHRSRINGGSSKVVHGQL